MRLGARQAHERLLRRWAEGSGDEAARRRFTALKSGAGALHPRHFAHGNESLGFHEPGVRARARRLAVSYGIFRGTNMEALMECQGQIRFGEVPWEVAERLAQFRGNWLEFLSGSNAVVFRGVRPPGCPPVTAIPCELISLIDSIPPEFRECMPGGELCLKDVNGRTLRVEVRQGQIRIKWPQEPICRTSPDLSENAAGQGGRVNGWARFAGTPSRSAELRELVDRFGGLYPEEDMPSECTQNMVYLRFRNASIEPQTLIDRLRGLADPLESLQAEIEIESSGSGPGERSFRIKIMDGCAEATEATPSK